MELKLFISKHRIYWNILFRYLLIFFINIVFLSKYFLDLLLNSFTYLAYSFVNLFHYIDLSGHSLFYNFNEILIVKSCVGVHTYIFFTLFLLSLDEKKVYKSWILSCVIFTFLNLLRIILLVLILIHFGNEIFDVVHLVFYQGLTSFIVIYLYIFMYKKYDFTSIPVYSDIKRLLKMYKKNNKKK